jgi:hypothetical protein
MAQQTSVATPRAAITTVKPGAKGTSKVVSVTVSTPTSSDGSMIASIQGAAPKSPNCTPAVKSADPKAPEKPVSQSNCVVTGVSAGPDAHPSVVNLPAAQ